MTQFSPEMFGADSSGVVLILDLLEIITYLIQSITCSTWLLRELSEFTRQLVDFGSQWVNGYFDLISQTIFQLTETEDSMANIVQKK